MLEQLKRKWATVQQLKAIPPLPRTKLCDLEPAEIVEAIHRLEHAEKVDFRKRKGRCDQ
jgi:hypothetical protein